MDSKIEIRPGRHLAVQTYLQPTAKQTLFFIHGLGGRAEQWHNQIDYFKESFNIVAPDLLGHGNSDKPVSKNKNLYAFSEHEADLQALFRQFATERNILIGHSYGGALSASLAITHQDEINKVVLISPLPCTPSANIPWLYRLPTSMMKLFRPYLEKKFQQLAFTSTDSPSILASEMIAMKQNPLSVIKQMIIGVDTMPCIDVTMLTVPGLLLLGKKDQLVNAVLSEDYYGQMPNKEIVTLHDTGHMCILTQPIKVNKMLDSFIGI